MTWARDAACVGHPFEWFFPEDGTPPPEAFALCERCPVRVPCREEGKTEFGLWGGRYRGWKGRGNKVELGVNEWGRVAQTTAPVPDHLHRRRTG